MPNRGSPRNINFFLTNLTFECVHLQLNCTQTVKYTKPDDIMALYSSIEINHFFSSSFLVSTWRRDSIVWATQFAYRSIYSFSLYSLIYMDRGTFYLERMCVSNLPYKCMFGSFFFVNVWLHVEQQQLTYVQIAKRDSSKLQRFFSLISKSDSVNWNGSTRNHLFQLLCWIAIDSLVNPMWFISFVPFNKMAIAIIF